jgi:hypothetical protein
MNEIPPVLAADAGSSVAPSADTSELKRAPGGLSERHHKYAEEFKQWMLGLNRADFAQARRVLEAMTKAYFKHTIKVHSPPMRDANNDDSGKTSDGQPDPVLPDGTPAA